MEQHALVKIPVIQTHIPQETNVLQPTKLRQSHLTLSRYDERMPSPLSPLPSRSRSQSVQANSSTFLGSALDLKLCRSPNLLSANIESRSIISKFSKKLSAIASGTGSQSSVEPITETGDGTAATIPQHIASLVGKSQSDGSLLVFNEIVRRRRRLSKAIGIICFSVLLTGSIVTGMSYNKSASTFLPGKAAGPVLMVVGGTTLIAIICYSAFSDLKAKGKFPHRDSLLCYFKRIERDHERNEVVKNLPD